MKIANFASTRFHVWSAVSSRWNHGFSCLQHPFAKRSFRLNAKCEFGANNSIHVCMKWSFVAAKVGSTLAWSCGHPRTSRDMSLSSPLLEEGFTIEVSYEKTNIPRVESHVCMCVCCAYGKEKQPSLSLSCLYLVFVFVFVSVFAFAFAFVFVLSSLCPVFVLSCPVFVFVFVWVVSCLVLVLSLFCRVEMEKVRKGEERERPGQQE